MKILANTAEAYDRTRLNEQKRVKHTLQHLIGQQLEHLGSCRRDRGAGPRRHNRGGTRASQHSTHCAPPLFVAQRMVARTATKQHARTTGSCGGVINWRHEPAITATLPEFNFLECVTSPPVTADAFHRCALPPRRTARRCALC